jgi:quercetin dioxygenase-like cupin family protein
MPSTPSFSSTARRGVVSRPGAGEGYWFYGDLAIVRSPEGALPIIIEHHIAPGGAAPLHVHTDVDDSFYLIAGEVALRCGDQTFMARPGDYVSLPKGIPHTLRVLGNEEAVLLQTHDGPDFLTFIKTVGVPVQQPKPDMASLDFEAMNRLAGETGQPVLGPPMTLEEAMGIAAGA